jgi:hypothetical protein
MVTSTKMGHGDRLTEIKVSTSARPSHHRVAGNEDWLVAVDGAVPKVASSVAAIASGSQGRGPNGGLGRCRQGRIAIQGLYAGT